MDYDTILSMEPKKLLNWLTSEFVIKLPGEICTAEDMDKASMLLLQLSNEYSYLCALSSAAKIATREAKRSGDKEAHENMVDKKDTIVAITECVKQQYAAISRSVTIRIENNQELRMNANGYIKKDK